MSVNLYNAERYLDPTAYEALMNIEREAKRTAYKPLVFICKLKLRCHVLNFLCKTPIMLLKLNSCGNGIHRSVKTEIILKPLDEACQISVFILHRKIIVNEFYTSL